MTTLEDLARAFWDCEADPQGWTYDKLSPAYRDVLLRRMRAVVVALETSVADVADYTDPNTTTIDVARRWRARILGEKL